MTRPSRHRPAGLCLIAVAIPLVLGGCKGDDPPIAAPTTTTAATTTVGTTAAPTTTTIPFAQIKPGSPEDKAAVLSVLSRYWDEYLVASDPPDPERPALFALLEGEEAISTHEGLLRKKETGKRARRSKPGPTPNVASEPTIETNKATTDECILDDAVTYDASGAVLDNEVIKRSYRTILNRKATGWVIASRRETPEKGSNPLCAALPSS